MPKKTSKATYVDGFVLVVPKKNKAAYKKMAQFGKKLWMKHGALDYMECIGDDLKPKAMGGPIPLTFLKMAKAKPTDTVWFSFITYKSKKHRDEVNKKVMSDPIMNDPKKWENFVMPNDMKKMAYGGFKAEVSA